MKENIMELFYELDGTLVQHFQLKEMLLRKKGGTVVFDDVLREVATCSLGRSSINEMGTPVHIVHTILAPLTSSLTAFEEFCLKNKIDPSVDRKWRTSLWNETLVHASELLRAEFEKYKKSGEAFNGDTLVNMILDERISQTTGE